MRQGLLLGVLFGEAGGCWERDGFGGGSWRRERKSLTEWFSRLRVPFEVRREMRASVEYR